ncbi:MAG: hypothetical protein JSR33_07285, partial [Proteobacteria bacterium]|nr:hypothetical protein [Pseudomonadota bacterium]
MKQWDRFENLRTEVKTEWFERHFQAMNRCNDPVIASKMATGLIKAYHTLFFATDDPSRQIYVKNCIDQGGVCLSIETLQTCRNHGYLDYYLKTWEKKPESLRYLLGPSFFQIASFLSTDEYEQETWLDAFKFYWLAICAGDPFAIVGCMGFLKDQEVYFERNFNLPKFYERNTEQKSFILRTCFIYQLALCHTFGSQRLAIQAEQTLQKLKQLNRSPNLYSQTAAKMALAYVAKKDKDLKQFNRLKKEAQTTNLEAYYEYNQLVKDILAPKIKNENVFP